MAKNTFSYAREAKTNPFEGFVSFQHFRGDPLYSDSVVNPSGDLCETEDFECYPVPAGIRENGDAEGYYPDTSVAYIRFLWRDFEPEQGKYDYDFIETILRTAESRGQTVMFRMMPHSTCARDDVPDWIRAIVDCPERPPRARFKDSPKDPRFFELFCDAVRALGSRFDADKTLDSIDISTVGAWGEGHKKEEYPRELLEKIVDTYIEAFPTTMLLCQMSSPDLLRRIRERHPVGTRADAMGQPYHREKVYPEFLKNLPEGLWKTAPVSGESYWWLGEWKRQGWSAKDAFDYMLRLHLSTFNPKYLPAPREWQAEIDDFTAHLGYHYVIDSFSYGEEGAAGSVFGALLSIENIGCAPIYHRIPLLVRFRSAENEYIFPTDEDIRTWMPGEKKSVPISLVLPETMAGGAYSVAVALSSPDYPDVYFATDAPRDGKWFSVGEVKVK